MGRRRQHTNGNGDDSSATNATELPKNLPQDTPAWGKTLYTLLNNSITSVDIKVTNIYENLQIATDTADKALRLAEHQETVIANLSSKVDYLSEALEFLLNENKKRDEHVLRNETYSRRDNLIFRGYTVARDDPETCEAKVRKIITVMGIPHPQKIPFVRCHYLNDQKQIIVRFQLYSDRERIWINRYKLKQTSFYVAEDFPSAIVSQRRQLYPVFKAAKDLPQYHKKVTMRGERLILDGKHYTNQTLCDVPDQIHPAKLAQRSNNDVLVFGGSTSAHHGLSNFYQLDSKFVYEHIAYSSAEQAFQHKKARLANDQNKQREIIFNADPITQKLLGQEVKGLNKEEWNHQKRDIMKDILISKFTQHPDLKDLLLKTGTKKLAEANARDNYFAIGLPITHPDVLDTTKWSENGNKLGEILMELRHELRS